LGTQQSPAVVYTVSTMDGEETEHVYEITGSAEEAIANITQEVKNIVEQMIRRGAFALLYPIVIYQARQVVKIALDVRGRDASSDMVRQIGFLANRLTSGEE
jgi:thiamine phosphate synthase YjbQ (UPF0047 family)